jgi:hypothetical protein
MPLFEIDKTFEYSRMAMIADLMRLEIIYRHGGFYFDTNYEAFKTLDEFRGYPFVGSSEAEPYTNFYFPNGLFGAIKGSQFLERLLSAELMDKIDYTGSSNTETGPGYMPRGLTIEEFYYDIKILPPDRSLPHMYWVNDERFTEFKCLFQ